MQSADLIACEWPHFLHQIIPRRNCGTFSTNFVRSLIYRSCFSGVLLWFRNYGLALAFALLRQPFDRTRDEILRRAFSAFSSNPPPDY
jgi:hypothetical protein